MKSANHQLKKVYPIKWINEWYKIISRQGSVVGIATAYGLDCPGIESQWGEIFRTSPDRP